MSARTFLGIISLPNPTVLAAPAQYTTLLPQGNYAITDASHQIPSGWSDDAGMSPGYNDVLFLDSIRLFCNFADGLVPVGTADLPANSVPAPYIRLFAGQQTDVVVNSYLNVIFSLLNEWIPINMAIPVLSRNTTPGFFNVYGNIANAAGQLGELVSYYTKSINPLYNGSIPRFEVHCLIKAGNW